MSHKIVDRTLRKKYKEGKEHRMSSEILEKTKKKDQTIVFHKPTLSREDLKGVLECLADENLSTGTVVERFEKDFSHTFKFKQTISANSLTSAYHLSLLALGVEAGDSVLLSVYAPVSALDAIFLLRAKPVLVDLGKKSFAMDVEDFNRKIQETQPKVILWHHPFGSIISPMGYSIGEIPLIEDYSDAIGADSSEVSVGKLGVIGICGLGDKHTITTGNGALVTTNDTKLANTIREFKLGYGGRKSNSSPKLDYNIIDYQAALGIEQLSKLGVLIDRKKKIAQVYLQAVTSSQNLETYFLHPSVDMFHQFPIVVNSNHYLEVERYFKSIQIGTERTHEEPLHHILELDTKDFPNAERLYQRGHLLPIYPNLTKDNIQRISTAIRRIY